MKKGRRFVAYWIIDMDNEGTDKHATSVHATYKEAHAAALAGAKKANAIEWVCVRAQEYDELTGDWLTVARWSGDYEHMEKS